MATSGESTLRGIDINKLARGFADQMFVMKSLCSVTNTKAREVRWYQKTAGVLDSTDTTGITNSKIKLAAHGARPVVVEESWTRVTSYVKKYFVESPWISLEDVKDMDIDILMGNVRALVRAVQFQVDTDILNAITDTSGILTTAAVDDGWDDEATGNPIKDILVARRKIKQNFYDTKGAVLLINSIEEEALLNFLINVKGSSIPSLATDTVKSGVLMPFLGLQVIQNEVAPTDEAIVFIPKVSVTWKQFMGLQTAIIRDPGIGVKIRVWEEGVPLVTDPKSIHVTTDTAV